MSTYMESFYQSITGSHSTISYMYAGKQPGDLGGIHLQQGTEIKNINQSRGLLPILGRSDR